MSHPGDDAPPERWLTRGVGSVGAASFFSDSGHEITTSLLPSLLTSVLHAGPAALGIIEGVSDALTGVSKLAGGPLSNDPSRRARLASAGYLGTALATGAIGLATQVWQVAVLRGLAWVSRGLRSPARDALLASLVPSGRFGRAFGLERAGDNAGAVVGPLLAAGLVGWLGVRHVLLLAALPGLLAAVAITVAAREARATLGTPGAPRVLRLRLGRLREAGLLLALVPAACFEVGNLAGSMLILRAQGLLHSDGRSLTAAASLVIVLYAGHNAAAALAAVPAGRVVDRVGPRLALAGGAACYVLAYPLFSWSQHAWPVLGLAFLLAGVGIGIAETAESTLVAMALPDELRGSGFAVLGVVQAGGDIAASLVVGLLWAGISATVGFGYAAAWMLAAVLVALALRNRPTTEDAQLKTHN